MDWILAILIWLSADKVEIDKQRARAASCSSLSYATMYRAKINEDEVEEQAGGGTPPAQPKRMVKRCVNGRCVITYE